MRRLTLAGLTIALMAGFSASAVAQGAPPPAKPAYQTAPSSPKAARVPEKLTPVRDAAARRAARVERMFRLADRNRDGVLTRGEYAQWYKAAARRRGPLTWRRHAVSLFRQLDLAQDNRLTMAEFAADPSFRRTRPGWSGAASAMRGQESGTAGPIDPQSATE